MSTPHAPRRAVMSDSTMARLERLAADERAGLYRLLVQSVQDYGIFVLDTAGHVASWNEGAERIKGYTAEEILGRHFSTFYPANRVAEGFPEYELKVAAQQGRFENEGWRVRKNGTRFWANVVITALRNSDSELVGFAKVTRDLTERRAAEEQRVADAQRVAAAEAANHAKAEFLASMSHELRTPLNAIGGYAELLADGVYGPVHPEQAEVIARIRRSQQHLLAIINDLLNYSRIEAGQISYAIDAVPVIEMVEEVCAMLEPQATRKGLMLERGACSPHLVVRTDKARTEQILLNLLSNAVKFTPDGGRIHMSCVAEDQRVVIRVQDTGPGVPEEKLEAIFEPFVQLGRTLSSPQVGVGLGLAISRDLARALGGDLSATSAPGEGTTFILTMPAA